MKQPLFILLLGSIFTIQTARSQNCPEVCPQVGLSTAFEFLAGLEIGPLFNFSGDNGGYADFSGSVSATFNAGTTYSYQIGVSYPQGPFSDVFKAWMDFNQDGDFEDPGELILDNFGQGTVSGSIFIPSTALNGPTKLRVAIGFQTIELCENVTEGEIEDYCVTIVGGQEPACDFSQPVTGLITYFTGPVLTLFWDAVPGSVGCQVKGGLLGNFNITRNVIGEEVSFVNFNLNALPDGTYNWKVRCGCSSAPPFDLTPDSEIAIFEVPGVTGITTTESEMNAGLNELILYPNPASSELNFTVTANSYGQAQFMVMDVLGRNVMQRDLDVVKGLNTFQMDVSDIPEGTYILNLIDGNDGVTTSKFIKQ
ncbi:MAG: T9SS type A sorting domain-containing protein [Flavobacteriales bacterium]|nr:T9SS type A sorting domain-containing protein [Flavobacteriales bacterium]